MTRLTLGISSVVRDLRAGARAVVRGQRTLLAAAAILGIGSSTCIALFGTYSALVLDAFAFPEPTRLVSLDGCTADGLSLALSAHAVQQLRQMTQAFESVAYYSPPASALLAGPERQRVYVLPVSGSFFPTLGQPPAVGRWIEPSDQDHVAVLSYSLWQRAFHSDRRAIEQAVTLDGETFRVVGVAPATFRFPSGHIQIWIAKPLSVRQLDDHFVQSLTAFARLRAGATTKQANAALELVAARLPESQPDAYRGVSLKLSRLSDGVVGSSERLVRLLLGAVICVLLVSASSATSILFARRIQQAGNDRIRLSLGATRARVVREVLCENLVVGLLAGVFGLAAASVSLRLIGRFGPASVSVLGGTVDWRTAGFALGVSSLGAILVTLLPAREVWRSHIVAASGTSGHHSVWSTRSGSKVQFAICCVQIAAAVVLSLGAGLLLRSAWRLQTVNLGFSTVGLYTVMLDSEPLDTGRDADSTVTSHFLEALEEVRGVSAVALVDTPVLRDVTMGTFLRYETRDQGWQTSPLVHHRSVMGDYFRAMGIPIRRGRVFTREDGRNAPCVVIVNEWMANHFWPSADPLRQRLDLNPVETSTPYFCRVIGVAADVRDLRLDKPPGPTIYKSYRQRGGSLTTLLVRTLGGGAAPIKPVLDRLQSLSRNPQNIDVRAADDLVSSALLDPRFRATLLLLFATVGTMLAVGGVYGVAVQVVRSRTREIGVRLVLGANASQVRRHVMKDGATFTLIGLSAGIVCALVVGRVLSAFLYEVAPTDLWVYVSVSVLIGAAALFAGYWPTRQIERADLSELLRSE